MVDEVVIGTNWESVLVSFTNYFESNGYITFMIDGVNDAKTAQVYLDMVEVDEILPCASATKLEAINITDQSAEITWSPLSGADNTWRLQVTRSLVSDPSDLDSLQLPLLVDTIVTGYSCVINNLRPRTNYYYSVRPVCAGNVMGPRFATSKYFRTECGHEPLPYAESFDTYSTGSAYLAECWSRMTDYSTNYPYIYGSTKYSGSASLYFYSSSSTYSLAVMPLMADSIKNLEISFMGYASSASYKLVLGVMDDPTDLRTFDSLTTFQPAQTSTWLEYIYDFSGYTGSGEYIALLSDRRLDGAANYYYIDDVVIDHPASCRRPTSISATSTTDPLSFDLSWNPYGDETNFELVYDVAGFDPNSATPIAVQVTNYLAQGLAYSTDYHAYVRSVCDDGFKTMWRGPVTFTTPQQPTTVPYFADFESSNGGWSFVNGSQTNQFIVGNAIAKDSERSLYISNTKGQTAEYGGSTTYVYAYRTIYFDADSIYTLNCDWIGQGQTTLDYGRIYVVPVAETLTAGTSKITTTGGPAGWISIDGGAKLNLQSSWQKLENDFVVPSSGYYKVVIGWRNDASTQNPPAIAIDNFRLTVNPCGAPFMSADSIFAESAYLHVLADSSIYKLSTKSYSATALDTAVNGVMVGKTLTRALALNNLAPSTTYYLYVRGLCDSGDTTKWSGGSFTTACADIVINDTTTYTNSFDSYSTGTAAIVDCWYSRTNNGTGASSYRPYCSSSQKSSGVASLYLYGTSSYYSYIATTAISGTPIKDLKMTFKGRKTSATYYVLVGVMSNPEDLSTFVQVDSISCSQTTAFED